MALQSCAITISHQKANNQSDFTVTRFIRNVVTRPEAASKHEMQYCLILDIKIICEKKKGKKNLKKNVVGKLVQKGNLGEIKSQKFHYCSSWSHW